METTETKPFLKKERAQTDDSLSSSTVWDRHDADQSHQSGPV